MSVLVLPLEEDGAPILACDSSLTVIDTLTYQTSYSFVFGDLLSHSLHSHG